MPDSDSEIKEIRQHLSIPHPRADRTSSKASAESAQESVRVSRNLGVHEYRPTITQVFVFCIAGLALISVLGYVVLQGSGVSTILEDEDEISISKLGSMELEQLYIAGILKPENRARFLLSKQNKFQTDLFVKTDMGASSGLPATSNSAESSIERREVKTDIPINPGTDSGEFVEFKRKFEQLKKEVDVTLGTLLEEIDDLIVDYAESPDSSEAGANGAITRDSINSTPDQYSNSAAAAKLVPENYERSPLVDLQEYLIQSGIQIVTDGKFGGMTKDAIMEDAENIGIDSDVITPLIRDRKYVEILTLLRGE